MVACHPNQALWACPVDDRRHHPFPDDASCRAGRSRTTESSGQAGFWQLGALAGHSV
jgi:hypothetical protein